MMPLNPLKKKKAVNLNGRQLSYADAQFLNFVPSPIARGKRDGIFTGSYLSSSTMCTFHVCACIFVYVYLFVGSWEGNGKTRLKFTRKLL